MEQSKLSKQGFTPVEQTLAMTSIVGVVLVLMRVFRLSAMVKFLSRAALSGFVNASAILIIESQIRDIIGLDHPTHPAKDFLGKVEYLFDDVICGRFANKWIGLLGVFQLSLLLGLKRLKSSAWFKNLGREVREEQEVSDDAGVKLTKGASSPTRGSSSPTGVVVEQGGKNASFQNGPLAEPLLSEDHHVVQPTPQNDSPDHAGDAPEELPERAHFRRKRRLHRFVDNFAKLKDLVAVLIGGVCCYFLMENEGVYMNNIGHLPSGLPSPQFPSAPFVFEKEGCSVGHALPGVEKLIYRKVEEVDSDVDRWIFSDDDVVPTAEADIDPPRPHKASSAPGAAAGGDETSQQHPRPSALACLRYVVRINMLSISWERGTRRERNS